MTYTELTYEEVMKSIEARKRQGASSITINALILTKEVFDRLISEGYKISELYNESIYGENKGKKYKCFSIEW